MSPVVSKVCNLYAQQLNKQITILITFQMDGILEILLCSQQPHLKIVQNN